MYYVLCVCLCVHGVCVCVRERERERECIIICVCLGLCLGVSACMKKDGGYKHNFKLLRIKSQLPIFDTVGRVFNINRPAKNCCRGIKEFFVSIPHTCAVNL